jgi:hypothetical protein
MDQKNKFEELQRYLSNYVNSSVDKHAALEDINHLVFVLHSETQLERQLNEFTQ